MNRDPLERFMDNVFKTNNCWIWISGTHTTCGYGRFMFKGKRQNAHRWIYEYYNGPIGNLFACHKCNNPSCVNPDHIYKGTQKDNMQDRIKAGNNPQSNKTYCKNGHKFDEHNTRIRTSEKGRKCRECNRIQEKERRNKIKFKLIIGTKN